MDPNIPNIYVDVDTYTTQHESVDSPSNIPLPTVGLSSKSRSSSAWKYFEKIFINNPNRTITFKTKYKYCAHLFSGRLCGVTYMRVLNQGPCSRAGTYTQA